MLWRTIIVDTTLWGETNKPTTTLINLLAASLDRGGSHPLTLRVAVEDETSHGTQVLELVSRHAQRWREVHFWTGFPAFQSIAAARGNLPLLEKLEISQNDDWTDFDVFEVAPRLTHFTVTGWGTHVPTVPWGQIQNFRYQSFEANYLSAALALLRGDFSDNTRCDFTLTITDIAHPIDLPSIVSNASHFTLTLIVKFVAGPAIDVLGAILGCLTFPSLKTLELAGRIGEPPLSWHQRHFLTFASRSSLHASLTALELMRITIDDDQLIACLLVLPLLEQLIIADCGEVPAVITDTFLRRLTWTADPPPLVPRLNFLCLSSLLQFSDDVYWNLVFSRVVPARWDGLCLEIKVYWLPGRSRDLSEEFFLTGLELEAQGELSFTARPDPEEGIQMEES
jgi:hypothetical protein